MGRTMNPYEANMRNVSARLGAWVRGMLRIYRKPLLVIIAATATMAVGVSATDAPKAPMQPAPVDIAGR